VLAALVFVFRGRIQFNWGSFVKQLQGVSVGHLLAAAALIYATYFLRAMRWAVFLKPMKRRVRWLPLLGPQFIGFTATALFGRFADLTRPYLTGKRTGLTFTSQVAVYAMERMFDLGAAAAIFSVSLALTPHSDPHYKVFFRAGAISLALTAALGGFALVVWLWGEATARRTRRLLGKVSGAAGEQAAEKILAFRQGLNAISSWPDLLAMAALSLLLWGMVGGAYVQTMHAFVQTPELASLTFARTMLLMAASLGGSVIQLPVVGWFTQIGITAAAMHAFFGAPLEAATAAGAMLQIVMWISVIPVGLVWARVEHVSLKNAEEAAEAGPRGRGRV
jgi:uncharacterized membrane protein YbhN (UPF0104 family)